MTPREKADLLLAGIGSARRQIEQLHAQADNEMAGIRAKYAKLIAILQPKLDGCDKDLIALMKGEREAIFDGEDKISLKHGVLLHGWDDKVRIPRDALEKIEAQGWLDAVKIAKSVDREVVETWPVEKLTVIGAERKPVEKWAYEVKHGAGDEAVGEGAGRRVQGTGF